MTLPDPGHWPMTRAELARRYGVSPSTVTRALQRAEDQHHADPTRPAPPRPVNPGQPMLRYLPSEVDSWWQARPGVGRPPNPVPASRPHQEVGDRG
ncbi:MAG: hypothetical protein K0R87_1848 [Pseudonocardia sp.]|nr:hypothetical protein [Pseudonocardia sp.]